MNILLIARCPPYPLHYGDRLILYHLAEQLAARGYTIDLLAFYTHLPDLADVPRYRELFHSVELIPEATRGQVAYLQRLRAGRHFFPDSARSAWSPEMWRAIERKLKQNTYDLVHVFGGVQVYEYHNLIDNLPNIIVPYESYSLYLRRAMGRETGQLAKLHHRLALRLAEAYERRMFAGYGAVVVLADRDATTLRALDSNLPVAVIPNGVDTAYFRPFQYSPVDPVIAFTGSFDYEPNADAAQYLIRRIFPQVLERVPHARLLLIGRDPPESLRALASPSIEITGRVPDIRLYLEQAMIVVSPLRMGAGIKNKVLEALALGKPMVATKLSCDGIAVMDGTHLLIGNNSREFAAAIVRLIRSPDLRTRLAQAGRALIEEQYTWTGVADQYERLYTEVKRIKRK